MTCAEVTELLEAFVDAELPAPTLLAVARHAGACPVCDGALREMTALHERVARVMETDAETLDLSGVWPAVARDVDRMDGRRVWVRRMRATPFWGVAMAAAAAAVIWFRGAAESPRIVTARPNNAVIERIASDGARFEIRSDRKSGTTAIVVRPVSYEVGR